MNFSQEDAVVSDGSLKKYHGTFDMPLAAILCIVIVIYGLLVLICIFMRQVILNRRPLSTLESLHCGDCLLFLHRPATLCDIPCGQPGKTVNSPCKHNFQWFWSALPRCRLPESSAAPSRCWPPNLPTVQCPNSVRCCGLEIRRDTRAGMVDASVSSGEVLRSPAVPGQAAASRGVQPSAMLDTAGNRHHGRHTGDSVGYSLHGTALGSTDSRSYSQHGAAPDTADSLRYTEHSAGSSLCSDHSTDSRVHSQLSAAREPGPAGVLSTAA